MFSFVTPLFFLGSIGQTTALALLGRQRHHNNTTLTLDKRQGNALVTRLSTIFAGGDATQIRTAGPGFDIRVDLSNDLFGFCPTTVIAATDCGLAGSCVDSFDCSEGCGFTDTPLTTFTCSEARAPFCSTALLTLSPNAGPYTYLACGRGASTDEYMAFTTKAEPSPTTRVEPTTSSSSTSPPETGTNARTTTESNAPDSTTAPDTRSSSSPSSPSDDTTTDTNTEAEPSSNSPPNTTGAIIGGTFGCLALLCGCIVFIFWLRHRNRNAAAAAAKAASSETSSAHEHIIKPDPSPVSGFDSRNVKGTEGLGVYPVAELPGRGVSAGDWQVGVGYAPMTPVELPAYSGLR